MSDDDVLVMQARRATWSAYRDRLGMADTRQPDFGTGGGIGGLEPDPILRLLVLPRDPDIEVADFNPEFWGWWTQEYLDPATSSDTHWGATQQPHSQMALHGTNYGDNTWFRYVALHRCLGVEMGLLKDATYFNPNLKAHVLRLTPAVARIWSALELQARVIERYEVPATAAPWEIAVAFTKARGTFIGHFAKGWAEPGQGYMAMPCKESGLLFRREIHSPWPDPKGRRELAFQIGAWLEDSFGNTQRRWIRNPAPEPVTLDVDAARWT
jgi:hypothetical protein